jgi:hypothetical protein
MPGKMPVEQSMENPDKRQKLPFVERWKVVGKSPTSPLLLLQ